MIAVAAFLSVSVLAEKEKKLNGFAMMEPFLPRLLHRFGINFQRVGADIDYHGIRAPYFSTYESTLDTMHTDLRELYQSIRESMLR